MAILRLEIPDAQANRVLDALTAAWGGPEQAPRQAKLAFVRAQLSAYLRHIVVDQERREAAEAITDEPDIT